MQIAARQYVTLTAISRSTGLPASWLKAEAEAGRLPALRVGTRFRFHVESVEAALRDRARCNSPEADDE